ncbi:MAG: pteridine-dependent deoxygenase [Lysobacterales bacterium]
MSDPLRQSLPASPLSVAFEPPCAGLAKAPGVLAVVGFGPGAPAERRSGIRVGLDRLDDGALVEVWRGDGLVEHGQDGEIRYAGNNDYLFGTLAVDERAHGDIRAAAEFAYRQLLAFQQRAGKPLLLRLWNYFSAITDGVGDQQRYRQFCVGRVQALAGFPGQVLPAATAIGRRDTSGTLLLYWLAARHAGIGIENPRQLSASRYPRQYGPVAPRFARATLTAAGQLLISGTASIVGHASHHLGQVSAQLSETLTNITALLREASRLDHRVPAELNQSSRLKVYLRHPADLPMVRGWLAERLPVACQCLFLVGDICRDDLLVEIEGVHGPAA